MDENGELAKILNKLGEIDVDFDKVTDILNDNTLNEQEQTELLKKLLPRSKK